MNLLVAYKDDPAGYNMAKSLATDMTLDDGIYTNEWFDLAIISTPTISADWLETKYDYDYDGYIFLSKHAAASGVLSLTCHSTGNFADANVGGNPKQVAVPYPSFQKEYFKNLWNMREQFSKFQITLETTHHGPTALSKPVLFVEIGTTEKEWNDVTLCSEIANIVQSTLKNTISITPVGICFGGTHYPKKFTKQILESEYALGTIIPKHALEFLDESLFKHIINQNKDATVAFLDWSGLGTQKRRINDMLTTTNLEIIKL
ncbi:MAG: D-aminoacyl-tRNA deacylase [Candidatus Nitrosoabyssus spongiisocia]|nr:MAG: D-aminoacyl-tRNA deacylase [Nitrosopumilaceae archaeon AB1(1)]